MEPITREEILLNAVAAGDSPELKPITREEMFLAKAAGMDVDTPEPITRREMFLSKIVGASSGGDYEAMLVGVINGNITNFEIPMGATKIRDGFFKDFTALQSVVIPDSVGAIGTQAFKNCTALQSVVIPGSVASIDSGYGGPDIGQFSGCTALESVVIEDGVQTLAGALFYKCSSLKVVKFMGVVSFVTRTGYYPFQECSALTDIYVPWAEGEVAGAPWGATNATIHYNHTEG